MVLWVLAGIRHVRREVALHTGLEEARRTVPGEALVAERHTGLAEVRHNGRHVADGDPWEVVLHTVPGEALERRAVQAVVDRSLAELLSMLVTRSHVSVSRGNSTHEEGHHIAGVVRAGGGRNPVELQLHLSSVKIRVSLSSESNIRGGPPYPPCWGGPP